MVSPKNQPQIMNRVEQRRQSVGKAEIAIQTSITNMNNKSISLDQSRIMI